MTDPDVNRVLDMLDDEIDQEVNELLVRCVRVENENIALATANSELRSELRELKSVLRMVTHG